MSVCVYAHTCMLKANLLIIGSAARFDRICVPVTRQHLGSCEFHHDIVGIYPQLYGRAQGSVPQPKAQHLWCVYQSLHCSHHPGPFSGHLYPSPVATPL